ncbi:MAG: transcriptional regulator [Candidatus Nanohalarchaeota archaeon]|nr:MAG: transcriptional regulator [Candidatus Nanohaloarchaeota archaeon]
MHKQSVAIAWRKFRSKYRLVGTKCRTCGSLYYPPVNICSKCRRNSKLGEYIFNEKGKIYSKTVVRSAAEGFGRQTPYVVAIIELEEGVRIYGQVVDCNVDDVNIGDPVYCVFRKMYTSGKEGIIKYGLKFKLEN